LGGLLQGPGIGYIATQMLPPAYFSDAGSDILNDKVCDGLLELVVLLRVSSLILESRYGAHAHFTLARNATISVFVNLL